MLNWKHYYYSIFFLIFYNDKAVINVPKSTLHDCHTITYKTYFLLRAACGGERWYVEKNGCMSNNYFYLKNSDHDV